MEWRRLVGEEPDDPLATVLPAARDAIAVTGDDDVVVPVRFELEEGHPIDQAEIVEQAVHGASGPTAEDVVDLGAEPIAAQIEGVGVATGHLVGLDDDHASAGVGEAGGHGETRHAGAHHEIVAVERLHGHGAIVVQTRTAITFALGGDRFRRIAESVRCVQGAHDRIVRRRRKKRQNYGTPEHLP
jgi:hypothetical protein